MFGFVGSGPNGPLFYGLKLYRVALNDLVFDVSQRNGLTSDVNQTELQDLLEPGAEAIGFEVLAVELAGSGGNTTLRVFIDGPQGVNVDDCARVSHQLSAILDAEDPIQGHYTLEVSSPGLDRPLSKLQHFQAALGRKIRLKTHTLVAGRRRFQGTLIEVESDGVTLEADKERYDVPFSTISKARLLADHDFSKIRL